MAVSKREHVVYLLGAGFSQPLEIPTVATFLDRAKTLQRTDPERFAYFDTIFDAIQLLERAHNFYRTDRTSVEDLLTMLDLRDSLAGTNDAQLFKRFISDVIRSYTPPIPNGSTAARWSDLFFGGEPWASYGVFVSALLGYEYVRKQNVAADSRATVGDYECGAASHGVRYSVISLNYDMVLEQMAGHINTVFQCPGPGFVSDGRSDGTPLVKLHGSVDDPDSIVPPVWSKQYVRFARVWGAAFDILKSANQIRIIGYSLPQADTYIRYLLRSAAVETRHLRRIEVLCLDQNRRIERRYQNFVTFSAYRGTQDKSRPFLATNTYNYLAHYQSETRQWEKVIRPGVLLERAHAAHFRVS